MDGEVIISNRPDIISQSVPNWKKLLEIWFTDDWSIVVSLGPIVIAIIAILLLVALVIVIFKIRKYLSFWGNPEVTLDIALGSIGSVTIKPNFEIKQIVHKAWAELITRKAAIQFDRNNDVIIEIHSSWYDLFKVIRGLIRDLPASQLNNKDTQKLVRLLVKSLNDGLRPHLTKWHAKFRRWYELEVVKEENRGLSPQEIQKKYKHYDELVENLVEVNKELVLYAKELKRLIS